MMTSSSSTIRISASFATGAALFRLSVPANPQYKRRVLTLQFFNRHLTVGLGGLRRDPSGLPPRRVGVDHPSGSTALSFAYAIASSASMASSPSRAARE